MAGLLAAQMLRRFQPVVHEAQSSLPHNHAALLRFRSNLVSGVTGIPFQAVQVYKAIKSHGRVHRESTVQLANLYSYKVSGQATERSILSIESAQRYVAPPNFVELMARNVNIVYGAPVSSLAEIMAHQAAYQCIISTIPMPILMDIVQWSAKAVKFEYRSIWVAHATIRSPRVRLYQTIYYPELDVPYYRASLTGDILVVEGALAAEAAAPVSTMVAGYVSDLLEDFGVPGAVWDLATVQRQKYGKLVPMADEAARKGFMFAMSQAHHLYSLGRFATWRQVLLDDLVKDVGMIEMLMASQSLYDHHRLALREG